MNDVIKMEHFLNIYNLNSSLYRIFGRSWSSIWQCILNTGKLQDHRFTMLLPQVKSLFWIKNLMNFQWFPQDYSSLTENIKPETMPCPLKVGRVGHYRLFTEMQLFRCKLDVCIQWTATNVYSLSTVLVWGQSNFSFLKITELPEELVTMS